MHSRAARRAGLALLLAGCAASGPVLPGAVREQDCPGAAEVTHSVFLVGDAGDPRLPRHPEAELPVEPVLRNLSGDVLEQVGELGVDRVAVIYLGDNVYPRGLAPPGQPERARGERILRMQIAAAAPARTVFLAGERDWALEGPRGWQQVSAQREFLGRQGPFVSMLPPGGCPGPERLDFGPRLRFVFIDPIGFGHATDFPESHAGHCRHASAVEAFQELSAELDHPDGRHVVLALHHPLITAGPPAGHSSEVYRRYIPGIYRASRPRVPLLFAGGHEHSLQLHRDAVGAYYAVSGAGSISQIGGVEPTETAMFALAAPGYMRLDAHADGALGLTLFAILGGPRREPVLRHCLAEAPVQTSRR